MNLKVGIFLIITGAVTGAICLSLPTITMNRVNFKTAEAQEFLRRINESAKPVSVAPFSESDLKENEVNFTA